MRLVIPREDDFHERLEGLRIPAFVRRRSQRRPSGSHIMCGPSCRKKETPKNVSAWPSVQGRLRHPLLKLPQPRLKRLQCILVRLRLFQPQPIPDQLCLQLTLVKELVDHPKIDGLICSE